MQALAVPGLSIAVVDDFNGLTKAYGGTTPGPLDSPITLTTIFRTVSIAEPLAVLAVLHQVEHSRFDSDADFNDYLPSWKLPDDGLRGREGRRPSPARPYWWILLTRC